jgi:hypothetical protein
MGRPGFVGLKISLDLLQRWPDMATEDVNQIKEESLAINVGMDTIEQLVTFVDHVDKFAVNLLVSLMILGTRNQLLNGVHSDID